MTQKNNYLAFQVQAVPLEGSNIIEASAGTGKTYSIAILALRLLLEKQIPIQEILMVTFTNAAVAELEERIRKFVRNAWRYSHGEAITDSNIKEVVDKAVSVSSEKDVINLLQSAVINLDETKVMTIHGFCKLTLSEFAFETGQLFSAELVKDISSILEVEIQDFWRKHITVLDKELLATLIENKLNQKDITEILNSHINGKDFIFYKKEERYILDTTKQNSFLNEIKDLHSKIQKVEEKSLDYISSHQEELSDLCMQNRFAKNSLSPYIHQPPKFLKVLIDKKDDTKYVVKLFPEIVDQINEFNTLKQAYKNMTDDVINYIYALAIQEIEQKIKRHMAANNLMTFDDMIDNLHCVLTTNSNLKLKWELQKKYKAIFIDEFQDTDRKQYEIFNNAFHDQSIIFYIGDPKQSIYGWRKADIATYFKARSEVENVYEMNINFRSTERLTAALNQFFLPTEDFDTFYFKDAPNRFDYHRVETPTDDKKGQLLFNNQNCIPISVCQFSNNSNINKDIASRILDLITNPKHAIYDINNQAQRHIRPSDIGILVRSNRKGREIKSVLSRLGIPAVTVDEGKVLQSTEAAELIYLLEAIHQPTLYNINRALLTPFIGYTTDQIKNLDEEKAIQLFRDYHDLWKKKAIYTVLMKIIVDFEIQLNLIGNHSENGERVLTNLYHLAEILYNTESLQHLNPSEVVSWLKVHLKKEQSSEDEWEQRIENDEDAVKIVTIHKSKGLQYNIVFAPDLDLKIKNEKDFIVGFRNLHGQYVSAKYAHLSDDEQAIYNEQQEQENRRLLYVALTRAVYKIFVYRNTNKNLKTTLYNFINVIQYNDLIVDEQDHIVEGKQQNYQPDVPTAQKILKAQNFILKDINWDKISYSRLAGEHKSSSIKGLYTDDGKNYDQFIFKELKKGAKTGNFLHSIFEHIDFSHSENWDIVIKNISKQFYTKTEESLRSNILELLHHVTDTEIITDKGSLTLNTIPIEKCLHELEFDFPFIEFNASELSGLLQEGIAINDIYKDIIGIMNGKVDLIFEHDNKFYILDWKSNYLGPDISDYSTEKVEAAMSENNYHLQYLIYSYAVQKYLRFRLGPLFDYEQHFGGVIYLFIRGIRKGMTNGIFFRKPHRDQILKMKSMFEKT